MWALHHELVLFLRSRNSFLYAPENEIEWDILVWTTLYEMWAVGRHRLDVVTFNYLNYSLFNCLPAGCILWIYIHYGNPWNCYRGVGVQSVLVEFVMHCIVQEKFIGFFTFRSLYQGVTVLNIVFNYSIAYLLAYLRYEYCSSRSGFRGGCTSSLSACVATSADDILVMLKFTVKKYII